MLGIGLETAVCETRHGRLAGLRWTPRGGSVDFDIFAGRYIDGSTRNAVTFGITLRR